MTDVEAPRVQLSMPTMRRTETRPQTFPQQLWTNLKMVVLGSKLNILLVFLPVAVAMKIYDDTKGTGKLDGYIFVASLLSLCPLAERLGFITEELATYTNDTIGGLLNATFGNATEVIISGFALKLAKTKGSSYLRIVQLSLLGSILSNLLLVLGSAFLVGGIVHPSQNFNQEGMTVNSGLLVMAVAAILLPSTLKATGTEDSTNPESYGKSSELNLSRFESLFMLGAYGLYLVFQLCTHRHLFEDDEDAVDLDEDSDHGRLDETESTVRSTDLSGRTMSAFESTLQSGEGCVVDPRRLVEDDGEDGITGNQTAEDFERAPLIPRYSRRGTLRRLSTRSLGIRREDEVARLLATTTIYRRPLAETTGQAVEVTQEISELGLAWSLVWLAIIAVLIAVLSEFVVDSIQAASRNLDIPFPFLSTIILPIVGNAAEHASAILFAYKNRMEITLGVAVGSSTQVAVLVIPFCVILGWMMKQPLDLNFETFEAVALFLSVFLTVITMHDGTSNWLKGVLLLTTYIFISAAFWVHDDVELSPASEPTSVNLHRQLFGSFE